MERGGTIARVGPEESLVVGFADPAGKSREGFFGRNQGAATTNTLPYLEETQRRVRQKAPRIFLRDQRVRPLASE